MQLTVVDRSGHARDVKVASGSEAITLGQLRPALADAFGAADTISSGGKPLADHLRLGAPGLRAGSVLHLGPTGRRTAELGSALQLRVIAGPDCGSITPLSRGILLIGRDANADVVINDPDLSRRHAELSIQSHEVTIRDLGTTNGTQLDGRPVGGDWLNVQPGAVISLGNSRLSLLGTHEPPAVARPDGKGYVRVHRPPRVAAPAQQQLVDFPIPPTSTLQAPPIRWLAAALPALLTVVVAAVLGSVQLLAFALLSPLSVLTSTVADRRDWRRRTQQDDLDWHADERRAEQRLESLVGDEARARHRQCPDPASIMQTVALPDCRLWERRIGDAVFLTVSLGIADQPSWVQASRGNLAGPESVAEAVPATVQLTEGPLGAAGPIELVRATAGWMLAQLVALHSPSDLHVAALLDGGQDWRWLRWIGTAVPRVATTTEQHRQLVDEIQQEATARLAARGSHKDGWTGPWLVVLVDLGPAASGLTGLRTILDRGTDVGITAICLADDPRLLPSGCRSTAITVADTGCQVRLASTGRADLLAVADRVSTAWTERFARHLAPLMDPDAESSSRLPGEVSLVELLKLGSLKPATIQDSWRSAGGSLTAPIGVTVGGCFSVDLVRDGPHLLIAGTTGSGKSELLRCLVLALAANHSPAEVSFVLIDYKGGAAFAECGHLPHTVGIVTDLDEHLTRRALTSLEAELRRRETAFANAGVADLNDYRRTADSTRRPISRLVLMIDEFATLAAELPQFLAGLLSIAQRGRSLGVHLVLATQRPAGTVSADIKANISLRIALRVLDINESIDVIGDARASSIPRMRPGLAVARLGDTELLEFQAARVGLPVTPVDSITVTELDQWNHPLPQLGNVDDGTDLPLLIDAIRRAAGEGPWPEPPWLPPLPELVTVADLPEPAHPYQIGIGLADDPHRQSQFCEQLDLAEGHCVGFIGGSRSGRTTALRTVAGRAVSQLNSDRLHLYLIDCAGQGFTGWSELPHCGAQLDAGDPAGIVRLIGRLAQQIADRRLQLAELGATTLTAAHRAGSRLPAVLLVVDGWSTLCELSDDIDSGRGVDALIQVMRDGPAVGLTVLVGGDRSMLGIRLSSVLERKYILPLTDRDDYAIAGLTTTSVPVRPRPGRAVILDRELEVQLGLLTPDPSPRAQTATAIAQARSDAPGSCPPAVRIRSLPDLVDYHELLSQAASQPAGSNHCLLGIGGDEAKLVYCGLFSAHHRFLIAGPARSGRSTCAMSIAGQAHDAGHQILVAAASRSPLAKWATTSGHYLLDPTSTATPEHDFDLLLVDDAELFADTVAGDYLSERLIRTPAPAVVSARSEDLLASFRGIGTEIRRHRTGLLLQPGPADGELLGIRVGPARRHQPAGRGLLVTDETRSSTGNGLAVQVAR